MSFSNCFRPFDLCAYLQNIFSSWEVGILLRYFSLWKIFLSLCQIDAAIDPTTYSVSVSKPNSANIGTISINPTSGAFTWDVHSQMHRTFDNEDITTLSVNVIAKDTLNATSILRLRIRYCACQVSYVSHIRILPILHWARLIGRIQLRPDWRPVSAYSWLCSVKVTTTDWWSVDCEFKSHRNRFLFLIFFGHLISCIRYIF